MTNSGGIIAALLAGCAIGVGLGILYAPDKGKVTRQKMKDKTKEKAEEFEEGFNKKVEEMRDKLDELILELEKKLKEFRTREKV